MRAAVTTGLPITSGGQRHSSETPTSESASPRSAIISVALGNSEQTLMPIDCSPPVRRLASRCSFKRDVHGRRGQHYLLCRNESIDAKYPPQPCSRASARLLPEHHLGRLDENGDVVAG